MGTLIVKISPLWLAIGAAISVTAGGAQQVGSAQQGLTLARQVCSPCHLVVKEAGRSTDPNAPTFVSIANTRGMTRAALASVLQTSHRTMPNIVLKGDDISDIVTYILSLKEND